MSLDDESVAYAILTNLSVGEGHDPKRLRELYDQCVKKGISPIASSILVQGHVRESDEGIEKRIQTYIALKDYDGKLRSLDGDEDSLEMGDVPFCNICGGITKRGKTGFICTNCGEVFRC